MTTDVHIGCRKLIVFQLNQSNAVLQCIGGVNPVIIIDIAVDYSQLLFCIGQLLEHIGTNALFLEFG